MVACRLLEAAAASTVAAAPVDEAAACPLDTTSLCSPSATTLLHGIMHPQQLGITHMLLCACLEMVVHCVAQALYAQADAVIARVSKIQLADILLVCMSMPHHGKNQARTVHMLNQL